MNEKRREEKRKEREKEGVWPAVRWASGQVAAGGHRRPG